MRKFILKPYKDTWFGWDRVNNCFWPGRGNRSDKVDPFLAPVRLKSGIYVIAWGKPSERPNLKEEAIQYIGMTHSFKDRIGQFATSAGIHWEGKYDGHSAAWRWPEGKSEKMKIAFFPLYKELTPHLKSGYLYWQEALAIDLYYTEFGCVPPLNTKSSSIKLK